MRYTKHSINPAYRANLDTEQAYRVEGELGGLLAKFLRNEGFRKVRTPYHLHVILGTELEGAKPGEVTATIHFPPSTMAIERDAYFAAMMEKFDTSYPVQDKIAPRVTWADPHYQDPYAADPKMQLSPDEGAYALHFTFENSFRLRQFFDALAAKKESKLSR